MHVKWKHVDATSYSHTRSSKLDNIYSFTNRTTYTRLLDIYTFTYFGIEMNWCGDSSRRCTKWQMPTYIRTRFRLTRIPPFFFKVFIEFKFCVQTTFSTIKAAFECEEISFHQFPFTISWKFNFSSFKTYSQRNSKVNNNYLQSMNMNGFWGFFRYKYPWIYDTLFYSNIEDYFLACKTCWKIRLTANM